MTTSLLEKILDDPDALSVRFQPIFRLRAGVSQVDSVEGLIRGPRATNFERADILFDYVRRKHAEAAVDRSCIVAICKAVLELPPELRINVNVHASTLGHNPGFADFFRRQARNLSLSLDRFTLEIVEHAPTYNIPSLTCSIRALRDLGVRIALDDVGLGNSNYRMILDCHPDYFKLDAYFAKGVTHDADRRAVVRSVMCLAEEMKGSVVAEGVQSSEDLATLGQMGVELFQADLLCPAMQVHDLAAKGFVGLKMGSTPATRVAENVQAFERARQKLLEPAAKQPLCQ
ncbi:MAG: EAL domain-containing protein [Acidobacteriia bacterium]|nr:EAL domain-containing protein [Terriglobia bacterium]